MNDPDAETGPGREPGPGSDFDSESAVADSVLAEWAADLADRLEAGEVPNLAAYLAEHPERASELCRLLPIMASVADLGALGGLKSGPDLGLGAPFGPELEPGDKLTKLGEFRLIREVGRGGMGIVYEAFEVPLGRRVALKVLPFAAALDPRQHKRFQLETQAVASLNHRNIVPIFSVGRDQGVSYFAMQLIEGRTLAELNRELRQIHLRGSAARQTTEPGQLVQTCDGGGGSPAERELKEKVSLDPTESAMEGEAPASQAVPIGLPPPFPLTRGRAFFRTVADLGRQAAEALAHVHELGIQHRDIKPANLLVDARGHLWVTDFGLAHLQGEGELTRTGDVVGTLRYMSPEQALGKRGLIDHRTDIYSLGATLYELLALRPAFDGDDRQDLLSRIAQSVPTPPRRLDRAVPLDLDTIIGKAMAREPAGRYATAQELADDLTRYLENRPILARRLTLRDRTAKWVRRRWQLVATTVALTFLIVTLAIAGLSWTNTKLLFALTQLQHEVARADNNAREAERLRHEAEERQRLADQLLYDAQIRLADQALRLGQFERAQTILGDIGPGADGIDPRDFAWRYLQRLATREIVVLRGHDSLVQSIVLSPDGHWLASLDATQRVLLHDVESGKARVTLEPSSFNTDTPQFSPDGTLLLTAKNLGVIGKSVKKNTTPSVILWKVSDGREVSRLEFDRKTNGGYLLQSGFVGGGRFLSLLWVESDSSVSTMIWSLAPDPSRPRLCSETKGLDRAFFATNGRLFGSIEGDRLRLRNLEDGAIVHELPDPIDPELSWTLSPDGKMLVSTGPGHGITIRETGQGTVVFRDEATVFVGPLRFSADGQTIIDSGDASSGLVHIWNRAEGRCSSLRPDPQGQPRGLSTALSADGRRLAVSCMDQGGGGGPVTVWDVPNRRLLRTFPGRHALYDVPVFSADGRSLFLSGSSEICHWWIEPAAEEMPRTLPGHRDEAWVVVFSPVGQMLATGSDDTDDSETIKLWDTVTNRLIRGWKGHPDGTVSGLAFSPDGRVLASVALATRNNVQLWDVATGLPLVNLPGHTAFVRTVAFSPDGSLLATAGDDYTVRLWDPASGALRGKLVGHTDKVRQVAFSPDGQLLASAGNDHTLRLWHVASQRLKSVQPGSESFAALAFSPSGDILATADEAGELILWDPQTGANLRSINCDDGELRELTFTPDGSLLAVAGISRTIHLWDMDTRQELMGLEGHQHWVNGLAFSADGLTLASCSHDGVVKLWQAGEPDADAPRREIDP